MGPLLRNPHPSPLVLYIVASSLKSYLPTYITVRKISMLALNCTFLGQIEPRILGLHNKDYLELF